MNQKDTIHLLQECDAGVKMAVRSIRQVNDDAKSTALKNILSCYLKKHENLGDELHQMLAEYGESEKAPKMMAQIMSDMTIGAKMLKDDKDQEIAEVISDGCHMGMKSISRYLNQYPKASEISKGKARELVGIEQKFMEDMRSFL